MKQLLLMRHGKSDWNRPGEGDIERSLTPRGRRAAMRVATWIVEQKLRPDWALVSTARRAEETWQQAEGVFGAFDQAKHLPALYLASAGELLSEIAKVPDTCQRLIIIGHNPGIESLSHALAGSGSGAAALDDLRRGFATAALAVFELVGDSWKSLSADGARLTAFARPRELD